MADALPIPAPAPLLELVPADGSAVIQSTVQDPSTGNWFVLQDTGGDNARISRCSPTGAYLDSMNLTGCGPISTFGLQHIGSQVNIWSAWKNAPTSAFNLPDALPSTLATLNTPTTTAMQSVFKDAKGYLWATQTTLATSGTATETTVLSRFDSGGNLLDYMTITAGGHGLGFAIDYSGSQARVYWRWQYSTTKALVRFNYAGGTTIAETSSGITTILPGPIGFFFVNVNDDRLAVRDAGGTVHLYQWSAVLSSGSSAPVLNTISVPVSNPTGGRTYQGQALDQTYLYELDGDASAVSPERSRIISYSWATGAVQYTRYVDSIGLVKGVAPGNINEPEGLQFVTGTGDPVLIMGLSQGVGAAGTRVQTLVQFTPGTSAMARYAYTGGATQAWSNTVMTRMSRFGLTNTEPVVDETNDLIGYRWWARSTDDNYQLRRLSDVVAGLDQPLGAVTAVQGAVQGSTITPQGFGFTGDRLYRLVTVTPQDLIEEYDWSTGYQVAVGDVTGFARTSTGAPLYGTHREPGGAQVVYDATSGLPSLIAGFTVGTDSPAAYRAFAYSVPVPMPTPILNTVTAAALTAAPFLIEVYDRAFNKLGAVTGYTSCSFTVRLNGVGAGQVVIPAGHPAVAWASQPGARMVVQLRGRPFTSGVIDPFGAVFAGPSGTATLNLVDDMSYLTAGDLFVVASTTNGFLNLTEAPAESVIKSAIKVSVAALASDPDHPFTTPLTTAPDLGRGIPIQGLYSATYGPLGDVLFDIADRYNMIVSARQVGAGIVVDAVPARSITQTISLASGVAATAQGAAGLPTATRVLGLTAPNSSGVPTSYTYVNTADEAKFGRARTVFLDCSDLDPTDTANLHFRCQQAQLSQTASAYLAVDLTGTRSFSPDSDYRLGDNIPFQLTAGADVFTRQVSAITATLDSTGFSVVPELGDADDLLPDRILASRVFKLARQNRNAYGYGR